MSSEFTGNSVEVKTEENGLAAKCEAHCPYVFHHRFERVRDTKKHVERCRRDYIQEMRTQGRPVLFMKCKWNKNHIVPEPEIDFHDDNCPDNGDNEHVPRAVVKGKESRKARLDKLFYPPDDSPRAAKALFTIRRRSPLDDQAKNTLSGDQGETNGETNGITGTKMELPIYKVKPQSKSAKDLRRMEFLEKAKTPAESLHVVKPDPIIPRRPLVNRRWTHLWM